MKFVISIKHSYASIWSMQDFKSGIGSFLLQPGKAFRGNPVLTLSYTEIEKLH